MPSIGVNYCSRFACLFLRKLFIVNPVVVSLSKVSIKAITIIISMAIIRQITLETLQPIELNSSTII